MSKPAPPSVLRMLKARWLPPLLFLLLAAIQLFVFVQKQDVSGSWFLYGRDTLFHDAVVHIHIQQWLTQDPATVPLWMPDLQGGLPTVGSFLWTPLAPNVWPLYVLQYPAAQKLGWLLALWIAGCGAFAAARALRLAVLPALFAGATWMLSGHLVTLIHAGHLQKVMALSWLPWAVAGAIMAADAHNTARRARGIALAATGIAMTFLSGHPQIAYIALVLAVTWPAWQLIARRTARRSWAAMLLAIIVVPPLGLMGGGAQLLPGMEMSALSNRSDGVTFEEAVETSYPPAETAEFFIPRVKGSSVFGDSYSGDWGERIVSDYIGKLAVLLAFAALLTRRPRRAMVIFWMAVAMLSLLVGFGRYTPLYRVLYDFAPGFKSFRSPGTFMAATSLAFALLAGLGLQALLRTRLAVGRSGALLSLAALLIIVQSIDLARANRHFLFAWDWDRYRAEFLAPTTLDAWMMEENNGLDTHDFASELSLRPLLYGGRALNGYHPIIYKAKEEQDRALGLGSEEWYRYWGVRHLLVRMQQELPPDVPTIAAFAEAGKKAVSISDDWGHTRDASTGEAVAARWNARGPNVREVVLSSEKPGAVEIADISGPGTKLWINGSPMAPIETVELHTEVSVSGAGSTTVRWAYRPRSWNVGVFLTALTAAIVVALASAARRPRRRLVS